jgi:hypothetical protein
MDDRFEQIQIVKEKVSDVQLEKPKSYQRIKRLNKENGKTVVELIDQHTNKLYYCKEIEKLTL